MPAYGSQGSGVDLRVGDSLALFNAETLTAPAVSISFARGQSPGGSDAGTTFQMSFAAAPTAVLLIQGSNVDQGALYETLWTSTNTQFDNYTDTARWAFYRAMLLTQSGGGAVTVVAKR